MTSNPWTRRSFLAGSASAVAAPALAAVAPASEIDVVIVGAGAAGIAAARRFAAAGRRFTVLEATDHVGGRCVTDTRTFGVPFDRGAHWIYRSDVNPVARLAAGTGLDIYPAPPGQRLRVGQRYARDSELEDFLAALVKANRAIGDVARAGKSDISCQQALPRDLGEYRALVEFALGPYGVAKELDEVSAMDFARAGERDPGAFCRQGYGTLLTRLAANIPVQLSTPVTQIDTGRGARVEVRSAAGVIPARYAIVTVSTNALVSGRIRFDSGLPKRQLDAADNLKLGSFDHVVMELEGNPLGLQRDDLMFEKVTQSRSAALLANVSGTSLAMVEIGGRLAKQLTAGGELFVAEFASEWLANLYGENIKKSIKRPHATRWDSDVWTLGAWSSAAPGQQGARRTLAEPIHDRVFIAGEATHETQWGTVGGAWESGERAADAILRKLGVLREPESPQEPRPARRSRRKRE